MLRTARATLFLAVILPGLARAWDPHAGVVVPFTRGAAVQLTSAPGAEATIVDENIGTFWQSDACMPSGYLPRADLNVLLGACAAGRCASSTAADVLATATDGNTGTTAQVNAASGAAWFAATLVDARPLLDVAVRGVFTTTVTVSAVTPSGNVVLGTLDSTSNYKLVHFVTTMDAVSALRIDGTANFKVTEAAARAQPCFEQATVDLGTVRDVGLVRTRHYAGGHATATTLLTSVDGVQWTAQAALDPAALGVVSTRFPSPVAARFIAVRHTVDGVDWAKVYVWEVNAYDVDGRWGPMPAPAPSSKTLRDVLGINGIWGWGTRAYSDAAATQGPSRYAPLASHGRNYHSMSWDVTDPDHVPDYAAMAAGHGTEAQWWLNWDREYGAWKQGGLLVDASIQFHASTQPESAWNAPSTAAWGYGNAFAAHFGPTAGVGLVQAMEVGNEPWDYTAPFYRTVLTSMAQGAKAGDPSMLVLPGAMQAHDPSAETATGGNYAGARVGEDAAPFLDALNIHVYSFFTRADGKRVAVRPEHPDGEMNGVRNMLRWRDANMPGRPVWVTEWGWDAPAPGGTCSASECVSEQAAAVYAVRGLLLLARAGIERATWFFYADDANCDSLFCRSGLVGPPATGFVEKRALRSLRALASTVGDRRIVRVLREDAGGHAYLLGDAAGAPTHLVAWLPLDGDDASTSTMDLALDAWPADAWTLGGDSATGEPAALPSADGQRWILHVSTVPVVVRFGGAPPLPDAGAFDAAAEFDASVTAAPDASVDVPDASVDVTDASVDVTDASVDVRDASVDMSDASVDMRDASIDTQDASIDTHDASVDAPDASASSTDAGGAGAATDTRGCACSSVTGAPAAYLVLGLVLAFRLRRRETGTLAPADHRR